MVDSHCHLYDEKIVDRCQDIISNFENDSIDYVIIPSCDYDSEKKAFDLAKRYDKIYCALAVHPHDAQNYDELCEKLVLDNFNNPKVVALGEFGFDYFYNLSPYQKQYEVAEQQMSLCNDCDLPAIFHIRDGLANQVEHYDAYKDFFSLANIHPLKRGGVLHCFGGDIDKARKALDLGFYISFTCNVTYKNNDHLRRALKYIPIDRLLIETDSPYLSPKHQRNLPNEPKNVKFVAECISEIKNIDIDKVYLTTKENTEKLFYKI